MWVSSALTVEVAGAFWTVQETLAGMPGRPDEAHGSKVQSVTCPTPMVAFSFPRSLVLGSIHYPRSWELLFK